MKRFRLEESSDGKDLIILDSKARDSGLGAISIDNDDVNTTINKKYAKQILKLLNDNADSITKW